jgi:hypothetical protein
MFQWCYRIHSEGPEKATREGVWMAYVPNQIKCASLLTRSRPRSYWKDTSHQNWVRKHESKRKHKMQTNPKITARTLTTALTASRAIHQTSCERDREITMKTQWEPRKTWALNLVAQEQDGNQREQIENPRHPHRQKTRDDNGSGSGWVEQLPTHQQRGYG